MASTARILTQGGIFVASGVLSTLVAQVLLYGGAADSWTMLLPLSNYAGMALASFVPDRYLRNGEAARTGGAGGRSGGDDDGVDTSVADDAPDGEGGVEAFSPSRRRSSCAARSRTPPGGCAKGSSADDKQRGGASVYTSAVAAMHHFLDGAEGEVGGAGGAANHATSGAPAPTLTVPLRVYVIAAIVLDILGFYLHMQGLRYAGSALFQVLYSSVIVWAALGGWAARTPSGMKLLLALGVVRTLDGPSGGKGGATSSSSALTGSPASSGAGERSSSSSAAAAAIAAAGTLPNPSALTSMQLAGVVVLLSGLAYSALSEGSSSGPLTSGHEHEGGGVAGSGDSPLGGAAAAAEAAAHAARVATVLFGLAASVACAMSYGIVYTLAELLMAQPHPPRVGAVAARVGTGISALLGSYALVSVVPRSAEVIAHVGEVGLLSWPAVFGGYTLMVLSAVAHSITYFQLMGSAGAVAAGVMQAARAVAVFVVSSFLFCAEGPFFHAAQCFTPARGVTTALVVCGILVYAYGKSLRGGH